MDFYMGFIWCMDFYTDLWAYRFIRIFNFWKKRISTIIIWQHWSKYCVVHIRTPHKVRKCSNDIGALKRFTYVHCVTIFSPIYSRIGIDIVFSMCGEISRDSFVFSHIPFFSDHRGMCRRTASTMLENDGRRSRKESSLKGSFALYYRKRCFFLCRRFLLWCD